MLIYVLRWRPSWISDRHKKQKLGKGHSNDHSFTEEDLWNFSQSEHIIGPGSHIEYPTGTKNSNFVEDHPRNIPAKFGSNRPSGFGEEAWNVKSLQTTDDRRRTTDAKWWQRSRWTKKDIDLRYIYLRRRNHTWIWGLFISMTGCRNFHVMYKMTFAIVLSVFCLNIYWNYMLWLHIFKVFRVSACLFCEIVNCFVSILFIFIEIICYGLHIFTVFRVSECLFCETIRFKEHFIKTCPSRKNHLLSIR